MERISTSAPGKLMLFGEHAVVYGYPCIVTAVDQRMRVIVGFNGRGAIGVRAPQVGLDRYHKRIADLGKQEVPKPVQFIEVLVKNFYEQYEVDRGLDILTESDFSVNFGFGSSAAVTTALAFGLSKLYSIQMSKKGLFDLCYKSVLEVQGVGSGFDIAAAIYGETLYFIGGRKEIKPLDSDGLPLIVGYTGVKADTPTLVRQVAELRRRRKAKVNKIFAEIAEIVETARGALTEKNYVLLGRAMDRNQKLLSDLGVSSKELDRLIAAARRAGALGAKLSGAGGGDCMVALRSAQGKLAIGKAIEEAGGEVIDVELGTEGVRLEKRA